MSGEVDRFPIGMRVLAVDDNPTCLMVLCRLLRECQYQVTTATQARAALRMLRENRNRFDLIIIDVQMPDMDGFKLLKLIGLEMDLPVIVSGNCDPKLVMKGIRHGACDYLVKPVRLEDLRNIWQHVIRRKKVDPESQTSRDNSNQGSEGGSQDPADENVKVNEKRKDEEEKGDNNENENDDPSSQKKPRVVWSIDLHRKFVAAVNQLGIDKAVPKRILDMMNVEGLTRQNVARHLQKYRLYLKRISMQQANMVATFGGKDGSYIRVGPIDDYRTLIGSGRLTNAALSSYPPSFSSIRKRSWCNLWIGLVLMISLLLFVCSILLNKEESLFGFMNKKLQIKREVDYFRQICKNLSNHPPCQRISRPFLQ